MSDDLETVSLRELEEAVTKKQKDKEAFDPKETLKEDKPDEIKKSFSDKDNTSNTLFSGNNEPSILTLRSTLGDSKTGKESKTSSKELAKPLNPVSASNSLNPLVINVNIEPKMSLDTISILDEFNFNKNVDSTKTPPNKADSLSGTDLIKINSVYLPPLIISEESLDKPQQSLKISESSEQEVKAKSASNKIVTKISQSVLSSEYSTSGMNQQSVSDPNSKLSDLESLKKKPKLKYLNLTPGLTYHVIVSHVKSPLLFWVQLRESYKSIVQMEKDLK